MIYPVFKTALAIFIVTGKIKKEKAAVLSHFLAPDQNFALFDEFRLDVSRY